MKYVYIIYTQKSPAIFCMPEEQYVPENHLIGAEQIMEVGQAFFDRCPVDIRLSSQVKFISL